MCHVSNKMQKSQFNAKYDCSHEDALIFSLLLVLNIKLLVLLCTSLEIFYSGLVSPKTRKINIKCITKMLLGCQDLTLYCPGDY